MRKAFFGAERGLEHEMSVWGYRVYTFLELELELTLQNV